MLLCLEGKTLVRGGGYTRTYMLIPEIQHFPVKILVLDRNSGYPGSDM